MKNLFLLLLSFVAFTGYTQTSLKPVTWSATYVSNSATEGEIQFTATIEKKWHIYSQRPTDVGPIPTSFTISANSDIELIGKVVEENAHEEYVPAFDAKVFVFSEKAVFKQKIKLKNQKGTTVKATLEFMSCNDVKCLPPDLIDFSVIVPSSLQKK
jgi:hypothetical protein